MTEEREGQKVLPESLEVFALLLDSRADGLGAEVRYRAIDEDSVEQDLFGLCRHEHVWNIAMQMWNGFVYESQHPRLVPRECQHHTLRTGQVEI